MLAHTSPLAWGRLSLAPALAMTSGLCATEMLPAWRGISSMRISRACAMRSSRRGRCHSRWWM